MMRVEDDLSACAWIGPSGLAADGAAGVCVFDVLAGLAKKAWARMAWRVARLSRQVLAWWFR